jgi:hypothetical protein
MNCSTAARQKVTLARMNALSRGLRTSRIVAAACIAVAAFSVSTSYGASATFLITATGLEEVNSAGVPNQGDPDGFANGTLTLNSGTTGTTGSATFNLTIGNLDVPFSGFHIHQAPATTTGNIVLDFGTPENFRNGNTVAGTVNNLSSTTVNNVLANPAGFYFNMHNTPFPSGAVRDQLTTPIPEPSSAAIIAAAGIATLLAARRLRRA